MVKASGEGITRVIPPKRSDILIIRALICCGLLLMIFFVAWFADGDHVGYAPVYCLLTFALVFKLVKMIHEWYHYWSPSIPARPPLTKQYTVDILTTACPGEPREMILRTLRAMTEITYPHTNYLCDEGNDPELRAACEQLGVIHVTREKKIDAKAGNINNALKQATGEICVVLDPDHVPIPEFLDRVLPYFADNSVGFVQCVQAYGNQSESFIARGAAEQTYHFYGPMMMCMNTYGTVQAIGANCTFRRSALDSIGGHAAGLSEDMHTAMQLHANGWKSVYVPEILTRGLVPATLSSYYKQQLKWSRGTFELLFRTFPGLSSKFTWRQKLHYFTIPLYFLFGLINLVDIIVPLVALSLAQVPWEVDLALFALYFTPLCVMSLFIRLYAQRWLLEDHERGLHMAGGILRLATWWIFLVGFVYTIFKIKVPYIPTPKEDEHQNFIRLSIPNLAIGIVCGFVIYYGLAIDWSPYSLAMAGYSCLSAGMLCFAALMSQQKFLIQVKAAFSKIPVLISCSRYTISMAGWARQFAYQVVKNGPVMLVLALSLVFYSYSSIEEAGENEMKFGPKDFGGFYVGTELDERNPGMEQFHNAEEQSGGNLNLVSVTVNWKDSATTMPAELIDDVRAHGAIPFVNWNVTATSAAERENFYSEIYSGRLDNCLKGCAAFFRKHADPVFISFPLESKQTLKESSSYIKAWQYLYTFFNELGISNLTWVWTPANEKQGEFYPGEKFVDWIGVSCLNFSQVRGDSWYSFSQLYEPYRSSMGRFQKPVMITRMGSVAGPLQHEWLNDALKAISKDFHEVKGIVVYNGRYPGRNASTAFRFDLATASVSDLSSRLNKGNFSKRAPVLKVHPEDEVPIYRSAFVKGSPGDFTLNIHDKPYYIQGVAYNTAHDWRDGNMPLTRRQVMRDLEKIKDMGANTIRRYGTGVYDRNVLNIATEFDLNVLYGFWFDPKVDYFADSAKVQEYIDGVLETVSRFRDHPAVLAWSLGNESWGLLKHQYAKPYLVNVRRSYIRMIEALAQRIHQLDPTRPVFSCIEHEEYQLAGELVAFRDGAPSIDVIGVNSYYKQQISRLNHVAWQFDSLRPYLVSEFGPTGYWDPKYNNSDGKSVLEESDSQKAAWYAFQWTNYVEAFKGNNVGGFAYCWHDRMEGSYTWFGLTDMKGRPKPAYFALRKLWNGKNDGEFTTYSIVGPQQPQPGSTYSYKAIANGIKDPSVKYEWRLLKDEYLGEVSGIEEVDDGNTIELTIPEKPSDYRLYLHVVDQNGSRVTTASVPVKVTSQQ